MKTLPRIKFAHLPTALEPLARLSGALGGPRIWVKRDDQTGLAFGGNKTRKLEFLLAEAVANGARTLITTGADQSNHSRQTAAAAARNGFDCILVLTLPQGGDQEASPAMPASGNLLLDRLLGAEIVWSPRSERDQVLQRTFEEAWEAGRRPYLIPYGGSNPTGAAAYVFAMQELMEQDQSLDWIVFPSSSGGTQAGLVLGAKHFNFKGRVLGISVDERADVLQARVAGLANETAELLDVKQSIHLDDVLVDDHYLGGGYGVFGEPEREAVRLFAHHEGLFLDPVYTGRAGAGMIDLIRNGFFSSDDKILFWHTGGTPALFAGRYQDLVSFPSK